MFKNMPPPTFASIEKNYLINELLLKPLLILLSIITEVNQANNWGVLLDVANVIPSSGTTVPGF
jgi:hypothetical protein